MHIHVSLLILSSIIIQILRYRWLFAPSKFKSQLHWSLMSTLDLDSNHNLSSNIVWPSEASEMSFVQYICHWWHVCCGGKSVKAHVGKVSFPLYSARWASACCISKFFFVCAAHRFNKSIDFLVYKLKSIKSEQMWFKFFFDVNFLWEKSLLRACSTAEHNILCSLLCE